MSEEKKYYVTVPFAGSISVEVSGEPKSREDAFEKAMEAAGGYVLGEQASKDGAVCMGDYEYLSRVVGGNVCYAPVTEVEWEEA
jgi:hypothetical protein